MAALEKEGAGRWSYVRTVPSLAQLRVQDGETRERRLRDWVGFPAVGRSWEFRIVAAKLGGTAAEERDAAVCDPRSGGAGARTVVSRLVAAHARTGRSSPRSASGVAAGARARSAGGRASPRDPSGPKGAAGDGCDPRARDRVGRMDRAARASSSLDALHRGGGAPHMAAAR